MENKIMIQKPIEEIKTEPVKKNLSEKVDETYDFIRKVKEGQIKPRELKLPRKAKVRRSKLKKGWMGVLKIDENGNLSGEKVKISGNSFKDKEGYYHATDAREILFWNGKFPILIQQSEKINPINLRLKKEEKNETYGQKYVMAKMMKDAILVKKKAGSIIIWILVIVGAYIGYQAITGGL